MHSVTIKEHNLNRFLKLCDEYYNITKDFENNKERFIILSLQIHALKGSVPKCYWKYANLSWRKQDVKNTQGNI